MKIVVAVCATGLLVSSTESARAELVFLPGGARTISRGDSASRDTPVLELAYGPRAQASIGTDLGFFAIASPSATLHLGGYAMIALHNGVSDAAFPPNENWRGLVGFSASASADALARRWFGRRGALELTLVAGHESDHHTDGPPPVAPPDELANKTGDFLAPEIAWRFMVGKVGVKARLLDRAYLRGSLADVPAADFDAQLFVHPIVQPRLALYGEALAPRDTGIRLGFFARAMLGVTFVGRYAEVTPFVSFDAGNDQGVLTYRREARTSFGVRYAPW